MGGELPEGQRWVWLPHSLDYEAPSQSAYWEARLRSLAPLTREFFCQEIPIISFKSRN